jgi:hypothetical protein
MGLSYMLKSQSVDFRISETAEVNHTLTNNRTILPLYKLAKILQISYSQTCTFPQTVRKTGIHASDSFFSDLITEALDLILRCSSYILSEGECSRVMVHHKQVTQVICQLENAVIDTCTSSLSDGALYTSTFLINNK